MKKLLLAVAVLSLLECTERENTNFLVYDLSEKESKNVNIRNFKYKLDDGSILEFTFDTSQNEYKIIKGLDSYKKFVNFMNSNPNNTIEYRNNAIPLLIEKGNINEIVSQDPNVPIDLNCSGWCNIYDNSDFTNMLLNKTTNNGVEYTYLNLGDINLQRKISSIKLNNCSVILSMNLALLPDNPNSASQILNSSMLFNSSGNSTLSVDLSEITVWKRISSGSFVTIVPSGTWSDRALSMKIKYNCNLNS